MLTVTGSNFNGNAVVNWNAAPQSNTTHPMANTLSVMIPAADIATAGTAQVSVTNLGSSTPGGPYGGGSNTLSETSNSMTFTIKSGRGVLLFFAKVGAVAYEAPGGLPSILH